MKKQRQSICIILNYYMRVREKVWERGENKCERESVWGVALWEMYSHSKNDLGLF